MRMYGPGYLQLIGDMEEQKCRDSEGGGNRRRLEVWLWSMAWEPPFPLLLKTLSAVLSTAYGGGWTLASQLCLLFVP